jgi:hypothetical protein
MKGRERAKALESERRHREKYPNKYKERTKARAERDKRYKDNPEFRAAAVARAQAWYENNKERANETKRRYNIKHADKIKANGRNKWLKTKYGLTDQEWVVKFEAQGSKCGCCDTTDPRGKWQTDHCWKTGLVRSIVCVPCNVMVANHSAERLRLGADYVERWVAAHTTIGG